MPLGISCHAGHCGSESSLLGGTIGNLSTLPVCMSPPRTMEVSCQEGRFLVSSSLNPVSQMYGIFRNGDLPSTSWGTTDFIALGIFFFNI